MSDSDFNKSGRYLPNAKEITEFVNEVNLLCMKYGANISGPGELKILLDGVAGHYIVGSFRPVEIGYSHVDQNSLKKRVEVRQKERKEGSQWDTNLIYKS